MTRERRYPGSDGPTRPRKKPCLALMGEFSRGQEHPFEPADRHAIAPGSGHATQLPPVWIAHGDQPPYRVDLRGQRRAGRPQPPCRDRGARTPPMCGSSESPTCWKSATSSTCRAFPTRLWPRNVWQRVIHNATSVIWCTHATQAWRQSEAAVWESLPPQLHAKSLLLLTRMDKINSRNDRERLLRRVRRETDGLFAEVLPISLLQAIEAGEDREVLGSERRRILHDETRRTAAGRRRGGPAAGNGSVRLRLRRAPRTKIPARPVFKPTPQGPGVTSGGVVAKRVTPARACARAPGAASVPAPRAVHAN